jgi:hypothetical protein
MKNKDTKRLGRPLLGEEKRRYRIAASFTLEERNQILEIAEWCGLSPSEVLYRASLLVKIKPPTPRVDLEAIRAINEVSQNLNLLVDLLKRGYQIDTRVVGKYFAILSELKSVIMEKQ